MNYLNITTINKTKVLSGREEGKSMRKTLKLDTRDSDNEKYELIVPDVLSITASYFLACFGESVRKLGEEGFLKKYQFKTNNESINKNIKDGIKSALRLAMPF